MEKTIIFRAKTTVEGQEWEVDVPVTINPKGMKELSRMVSEVVMGLLKAGFLPRRAIVEQEPAGVVDVPVAERVAIARVMCPTCKREMKESNVQEHFPEKIAYFCPGKVASGYCKMRGSLNAETGEIKTWEVKK